MLSFQNRVRLLVIGSGLHGLAIAHDLMSRGWSDIVVVDYDLTATSVTDEMAAYDQETLFSLLNFRDFRQIPKALEEWPLWQKWSPHVVRRRRWSLQLLAGHWFDQWFYRSGLRVFGEMLRRGGVGSLRRWRPHPLESSPFSPSAGPIYLFDDLNLNGSLLKRRLEQHLQAAAIPIYRRPTQLQLHSVADGWELEFRDSGDRLERMSALYVVNALGADANRFLARHQLSIPWRTSVVVEHYALVTNPDLRLETPWVLAQQGLRSALRLDPWDHDHLLVSSDNHLQPVAPHVDEAEAVWRSIWQQLAAQGVRLGPGYGGVNHYGRIRRGVLYETSNYGLSAGTPSPFVRSEHTSGRGLLITLYNMKTLTYRKFAEEVGDRIVSHFGEYRPSQSRDQSF
jgi:glycerol-3-phosphate dehydrogenase